MDIEFEVDYAKLDDIHHQLLIALEQTADQMLTDLINSNRMPFDVGDLQNTYTAVDGSQLGEGKVSIITSAPQARRLYYHPEYNFKKEENANAGGLWWQDYIEGDKKDFAEKVFRKLVERRLAKL